MNTSTHRLLHKHIVLSNLYVRILAISQLLPFFTTCFSLQNSRGEKFQFFACYFCILYPYVNNFFMCFQTKKMGTIVCQKSSQVVGKKKTLHLPYLSTKPKRFLLPWNTQELLWDPTILLLWESIVHPAFPGDNNRLLCLSEVIARTS